MAKFTVTQEASLQQSDLWQGAVEYNGTEMQYRYYDGYDGQEVYVLTEQGWEQGTELGDVIYACCQEWENPGEFGPIGEEIEIDDELVEEYA
jgi:hypothetical protein